MASKSASAPKPAGEDDYRAQSDADTLMRAEEIRGDGERHEKAQKHVKRRFHQAARAMTGSKKRAGGGGRFTARAKLSEKD